MFVTREIPEAALRRLAEGLPGARIDVHRAPDRLAPDELARAARGAVALVCTLADPHRRGAARGARAAAARGRRRSPSATENIDLDAARRLGVRVANTPGVLTDATAEVAVALALACARRVVEGDRFVRAGRFAGWGPLAHRGHAVYGATVGIVGAGRIGYRVAATLRRGFDCEILVHSRSVPSASDWQRELGARFVPLDELLARSDIVSLHCPLTPETRHLIDARALARMKPQRGAREHRARRDRRRGRAGRGAARGRDRRGGARRLRATSRGSPRASPSSRTRSCCRTSAAPRTPRATRWGGCASTR